MKKVSMTDVVSSGSFRALMAVFIVFGSLVITPSRSVQAQETTVTFSPNPLCIPGEGSANVTATITLIPSAGEIEQRAIRVRLVDEDVLSDDVLEEVSVPLPEDADELEQITVTHTFTLKCIEGEVRGATGGSGESEAELALEFPRRSFPTNFGSGVAKCGPTCKPLTTRPGPPVELDILVQDEMSGLKSIEVLIKENATVHIPTFTQGTEQAVIVTASKTDSSKRAVVKLKVTNMDGCAIECDPVVTVLEIADRPGSGGVRQTRERVTDIPQAERYITVQNGDPGLKKLRIKVNGAHFKTVKLKDNDVITVDVSSRMVEGYNAITLIGFGQSGSSALVLISDEEVAQSSKTGGEKKITGPFIRRQVDGSTSGLNLTWGR